MDKAKIALVTGASSGLGLETAALLVKSGFLVYGGARTFQEEISSHPKGFKSLHLDATSEDSCAKAVKAIEADAKASIDILVNNAGRGLAGTIEDCPVEEAKALLDLNLFGVVRMTQAVLPGMRAKRAGLIINIGSLIARVPLPYQGFYGASKAAVAALSDSLAAELRPLGIAVELIEPGDFASSFTSARRRPSAVTKDYAEKMNSFLAGVERCELSGMPAAKVAALIADVAKRPRGFRHVSGTFMEKLGAELRPYIPKRLFESMLVSHYKV